MKKSIAMKWVKALRSGKYKQGRKVLKNSEGKYCCLGVMCEVVGYVEILNKGLLPCDVVEKAGMATPNGYLTNAETWDASLAHFNDCHEYSFDEIADIIQMCWEEL